MSKKIKRFIIIIGAMLSLAVCCYFGYHLYEMYNSGYGYSYYRQLNFSGGYKNYTLNFSRMRIKIGGYYAEKGKIFPAKYKAEDISIKIEGKFYKLSELTPDKLKQFKNCYPDTSSIEGKSSASIIYASPKHDKIYGEIIFNFEDGYLKYLQLGYTGFPKKFTPEIKIKNKGIIKLPISLSELKEIFPEIKYSSRTYLSFDQQLYKCFF